MGAGLMARTLTVLAFLCHWTGILLVAIDPPLHG